MHGSKRMLSVAVLLTLALVLACVSAPLQAEDEKPARGEALAQADTAAPVLDPIAEAEPVEDDGDMGVDKPVDITVKYAITTECIWRGINYSDYRKEDDGGRPNHEFTVGVEFDAPKRELGKLGVEVFAQFYSGMQAADSTRADHLGAVDYTVYWKNTLDDLTAKVGWALYTWPRVSGDPDDTNEFFIKLKYNDKDLYGAEKGVFNPYVFYAVDMDTVRKGAWFELGVDHEFKLEEHNGPMYVTVTPSVVLGIDNRYLHAFSAGPAIPSARERETGQKATRFANVVYGLAADYDLSRAFGVEDRGTLSMGAFIKFSDALREDILNDELWGGFQFMYKW